MKIKNKEDIIVAIIALLVLLYTIWFVLTRSPQFVTYTDLFAMWGGTLAIIGLFFNKFFNRMDGLENRIDRLDGRIDRLDNRIDKLDNRIDKLEGKINVLIKDVGYLKGMISK